MPIQAEKNIDLYFQNKDAVWISEEKVLKHFPDLPVRFWDLEHKMKIINKKWIDVRKRNDLLQILLEDIEWADSHSSFESIFSFVNSWVNSLIERYWLYLSNSDCLWELHAKLLNFCKEVDKKWTYTKEAMNLLALYESDFEDRMHKVIKSEMVKVSKLITVWNNVENTEDKKIIFKNKLLKLVGYRDKK